MNGETADRKKKANLENRHHKVIFDGCYLANVNSGLGFLCGWCERRKNWSNHRRHYGTETRHSWDRWTLYNWHSADCTRRAHNKTRTNHCWIRRRIPENPCINKTKQVSGNSSVNVLHVNRTTALSINQECHEAELKMHCVLLPQTRAN